MLMKEKWLDVRKNRGRFESVDGFKQNIFYTNYGVGVGMDHAFYTRMVNVERRERGQRCDKTIYCVESIP